MIAKFQPRSAKSPLALSLAAQFCESRAETEKIKLAAMRYSAVADICPIPTFVSNTDGTWVYANEAYLRMVGASFNEVIGDGWKKHLHQGDKRSVSRDWLRAIQKKQPFNCRFRVIRSDGKVIRVQSRSMELPCEAWVGYLVPATLTQDEQGFLTMESDDDLFFENTPDLLCVCDADGYFVKLNPAWTRVLGWNRDEMLSRHWKEFVHPEDLQASHDAADLMGVDDLIRFRNRYLTKDGSYCVLSWVSSKIVHGLTYGIARDVTVRT